MVRRLLRGLAALAALSVLGVVAASIALTMERRTDVALPAPTGPSAVGRVIYDWHDDRHEVLAWIWYPAAAASAAAAADYIPAQMRGQLVPPPAPIRWVARDVARVHARSLAEAPMAGVTSPVVMLRGGGSAPVVGYTTLAEDLASHGYVVVGIDVPFLTGQVVFPDGRVVRRTDQNDLELYPPEQVPQVALRLLAVYTSHMSFALDRLAELNTSDPSGRFIGRLDLTRVGAVGHSFGGAQSAQFCHDESRCAAGIDIDGLLFGNVVHEGMPKPFMFLMEGVVTPEREPNAEVRELIAEMRSLYSHLPVGSRQSLAIQGANHFTFGDDGVAVWSGLLLRGLRSLRVLKIDARRQVTITRYAVRTFFDAHLKNARGTPLTLLSPDYPELQTLDIH